MPKIKKVFNKHHQSYLLIAFFVFIFLIAFYSLNFSKKNSNISTISPAPTSITFQPTNIPIPTAAKVTFEPFKNIEGVYTVGTRNIEVKHDTKSKRTFLYLRENGQNLLIDSYPDVPCFEGEVCRSIPMRFSISSDNNYLVYSVVSEQGGRRSDFYYIPDKKVTHFPMSISYSGFSKNNKYFYACDFGGEDTASVFIYKLPEMSLSYQYKDNNNIECQYDYTNNSLRINYFDYSKSILNNIIYSFETNKVVSQ